MIEVDDTRGTITTEARKDTEIRRGMLSNRKDSANLRVLCVSAVNVPLQRRKPERPLFESHDIDVIKSAVSGDSLP